jgi:hypothetical protein
MKSTESVSLVMLHLNGRQKVLLVN